MSTKPPRRTSTRSLHSISHQESPADSFDSLRQLLESLSTEQKNNQDLLTSLAFALRTFTNLNRFLELVPVIASRLVGIEGALLVPFQADGTLWREQLHAVPVDKSSELLRHLASYHPGKKIDFANDQNQLIAMDKLVQRHLVGTGLFATSLVARGRIRGRLYIFDLKGPLVWSDIHRRNLQLVADLTGVAIENDLIIQEARRHESVDRQLSIGAEIQAQLLPNSCPVIDGVELAARCRPAFQVGGDYQERIWVWLLHMFW